MSKSANNSFAKSMNLIDAYLFKHGHILPCGHHAEEGDAIDKACSMGGCGSGGISGSASPAATPQGTGPSNWGSAPGGGSMGIHATSPASTQNNYKGTGATSGAYWSGYDEG